MAQRNGTDNGNREKAKLARNLTGQALANLSAALEAGKSDTLLAYLAAMAKFHDCSFGDIVLIFSRRSGSVPNYRPLSSSTR